MSGTSKPPASENEPRRTPEVGDDGFGDGPEIREQIKNWESGRDDRSRDPS
jgi:hypothetical protein